MNIIRIFCERRYDTSMTPLQYLHCSTEIWGALFCTVFIVVSIIIKHFDSVRTRKLIALMFCAMELMLNDSLAWFFRGDDTPEGFYLVRVTNYSAFFFAFLLIPLVAEYLSYIVSKNSGYKDAAWLYIEWGLSITGIILITVNIFYPFLYSFDENNIYYRLTYAYLPAVIACLGLVISFAANISSLKYINKSEKITYLASMMLIFIAAIAQIFFFGISYIYLSLVISAMLFFISYIHSYMEYNVEKEKQLAEEKLLLINQQIQPHFIFNSLSLIRHLCMKAPEEAIETINEFSGYLRSSTDFFNEPECIPVTKELELVRHYIFLEQKRFGKSISVEYDITDTDFEIPPFAVQTTVENAIKHGLRASRIENGIIRISSGADEKNHIITIEDNGAGFDAHMAGTDDQDGSHTGIRNTSKRLEVMCSGSLSIESQPGKGTVVTIMIPKKKG